MSPAEILQACLDRIRSQHYAESPDTFHRDQRALTRALARYGYECLHRGWQLDSEAIRSDLMRVLDTMRGRDDSIRIWFPVYLESAVDRHIRLRAEDIADRSRDVAPKIEATMRSLKPGDLRKPTAVEVLAEVYRDLRKRPANTVQKPRKERAQGMLL